MRRQTKRMYHDYWLLMRRLLGYLLIIAATGMAFWLVAFVRDLY